MNSIISMNSIVSMNSMISMNILYFRIYGSHKFKPFTHSDFTLGLYKGSFVITAEPADSFINMKVGTRMIVIEPRHEKSNTVVFEQV